LVRANADRTPVHDLDEIHVGASRLESRVTADLPPESDHLGSRGVLDEIDEVGDSGIDGVAFHGHPDLSRTGERRRVRLASPTRWEVHTNIPTGAGRRGACRRRPLRPRCAVSTNSLRTPVSPWGPSRVSGCPPR